MHVHIKKPLDTHVVSCAVQYRLASNMSEFDCEFVEEPPKYLQTHCPICLLILYQVTCCGKSFCNECIKKMKARSLVCPTCNRSNFDSFPNKGLQQPLYGFAVFCSNKERGCVWEGELGQLDQHINSNPDKEKKLVGCEYTNIACLFCDKLHRRHETKQHQTSLCPKKPFTCFMCEEYESTYEDVVNSHAPVCKCRPVECPNSCGADNLQHQHLEEHVSSQCPLTYVECEFSDAGCDAKVYRKDLASHLTDNLVTHVSLLAMENRKLKSELQLVRSALSPSSRGGSVGEVPDGGQDGALGRATGGFSYGCMPENVVSGSPADTMHVGGAPGRRDPSGGTTVGFPGSCGPGGAMGGAPGDTMYGAPVRYYNPNAMKTLCADVGCSFKGYPGLYGLCPDCYREKFPNVDTDKHGGKFDEHEYPLL